MGAPAYYIEGIPVYKAIIPKSNHNRPGYFMDPEYNTDHNTANGDAGADAEMHARYLINGAGGRSVSWHFTVDDHCIYQHLPLDENGWHAGDGGNGTGNRKSLAVEVCENSDGNFQKAVAHAVALNKWLMKTQNISIGHIYPHQHWSGKYCPHLILPFWDEFIDRISGKDVSHTKVPERAHDVIKFVLSQGDSGQATENLQKKLIALGYPMKPWGADGHFGPATKEAVKNFQRSVGIKVDGVVGPVTRREIKEALQGNDNLLRIGDSGEAIENLQKKLNQVGNYGLDVDGIFGPKTQEAVKAFQKSAGIAVDGIVGPNTKRELKQALKDEGHPEADKAIVPYPGHYFGVNYDDEGKDVKRIQRAVNVEPDGYFGPITKAAVEEYQRDHGLSVDGVVGPVTWNVMF